MLETSFEKNTAEWAKRFLRQGRQRWQRWRRLRARRTITPILQQTQPPHSYDSEAVFEQLQRTSARRDTYRYDPLSLWQRGSERVETLVQQSGLRAPGARALEIGCGDGMTGYVLHCYGHDVTLADLRDWRKQRARTLPFCQADAGAGLDLPSNHFDLVFSFNTFEHIDDPETVFREMIRLCKPGGTLYLKFGPLYPSSWGLHVHRTIPIPYVQFLFSESFIQQKVEALGVRDLGERRGQLQPLNRWRLSDFIRLWDHPDCEPVAVERIREMANLGTVKRFGPAFSGRDLTFEDVTVRGLKVTLRKRPDASASS